MDLRVLEERFRAGYLWCDEEWVQPTDDGFLYWPGRLGQRFTTTDLDDGRVQWRYDIPVVGPVADADLGLAVCRELNAWACGWSFALDEAAGTVHALAGMSCPPQWSRWVLRFAQSAKLAGWFTEAVADRLGEVLGAPVLAGHPGARPGPRRVPDAVGYLPTALRERPEWVMDLLPGAYPPVEEVAAVFAVRMGAGPGQVEFDGGQLRIASAGPEGQVLGELVAGFAEHPLLGAAWRADVVLGRLPAQGSARAASQAAWWLFHRPGATLLGAWSTLGDAVAYRQWAPTGELRSYEQQDGFPGHGADLLWEVTSPGSDALAWALQEGDAAAAQAAAGPVPVAAGEAAQAAGWVVDAVGGHPLVVTPAAADVPARERPADRRTLWWADGPVLVTAAWFNPMGPTVATLELRGRPDGATCLVHYLRHPSSPRYAVVAEVAGPDDVVAALPQAAAEVFCGALPTAVTVDGCPDAWQEPVRDAVRRAVLARVEETGESLAGAAERVLDTLGDPWAHAGGEAHPQVSAALRQQLPPLPADPYQRWLAVASDPTNVGAILTAIPDAWDGALNYLQSCGALGTADTGPFLLTYSTIGTLDDDPSQQPQG